jgi:hypothetical protein
MDMRTPTTRIMIEIPVDLSTGAPQTHAMMKLATMLERGNEAGGNKWHISMDYNTGTIRLIPQP